jgi:hypothetical protein
MKVTARNEQFGTRIPCRGLALGGSFPCWLSQYALPKQRLSFMASKQKKPFLFVNKNTNSTSLANTEEARSEVNKHVQSYREWQKVRRNAALRTILESSPQI